MQADKALQSCLSVQETSLGLDQPDVAETVQEMALTVQAQGLKHQAEPVLRQCLAIRSHALGMQHPETASVLHALSTSLPGSDRWGFWHCDSHHTTGGIHTVSQAEPVLRQCLAIRSHALGMQHPETAAVFHAL